jgi:hypothetical protein
MFEPSTVYRGIFGIATLFLVVEAISNIINTKGKGTKVYQSTQWIKSLFMIVIGMSLLFMALSTVPKASSSSSSPFSRYTNNYN